MFPARATTAVVLLMSGIVSFPGCARFEPTLMERAAFPGLMDWPTQQSEVSLIPDPGPTYEVDLGSILVRMIVRVPDTELAAHPKTSDDFPSADGWTRSWTYNGDDAPGAWIITHPAYYNGTIGVIIDRDGNAMTSRPVIQVVGGAKRGRRWPITGGPAFVRTVLRAESWALRYGGERSGAHRFTVVEFIDDHERDVIQDFRIPFDEAAKGFSVKGVVIKVQSYGFGKIRYSFRMSAPDQR